MVSAVAAIGLARQQVNQAQNTGVVNRITQAIQTASARTGVSFAYLFNKASQESSLNPNATASTSSATGLFQFTQQTWLQTVKNNGAQFGLGDYANHIQVNNGVASVSDPTWKQAILNLRKDPTVSAEMAGSLDKENYGTLKSNVGGSIGPTELYLAHFLGAGGASDFLNTLKTNPNASGASVLPEAAAANQSVFYNGNRQPRTVAQIYQHFAQKFDASPSVPTNSTMMANALPNQAPTSALAIASNTIASPAVAKMASAAYSLANAKVNLSTTYGAMADADFNMASAAKGASPSLAQTVGGTTTPESPAVFKSMIMAQIDKNASEMSGILSHTASHHKKDAGTSALSNLA